MSETLPAINLYDRFNAAGPRSISRCCGSSLFCKQCATNLCFRLGPGCPSLHPVECDLELVDRVAGGLKPLATGTNFKRITYIILTLIVALILTTVVLSGKSDMDIKTLEARLYSSGLPFWQFVNENGMRMVAMCSSNQCVEDLVDVDNLVAVYEFASLPKVFPQSLF